MNNTTNENLNVGGDKNNRSLDRIIDYLLKLNFSKYERNADSNLSFRGFNDDTLNVEEVSFEKIDVDLKGSENSRLWIGVVIAIIVFVGSLVLLSCVLINNIKMLCENGFWRPIVYLVILALYSTLIFLLFKQLLLNQRKQKEDEFKQLDWLNRERVRLLDEYRDFARLQKKTELAIYDKQEKARIDEWVRDNEHLRKMEIMQQERISDLSKVILELVKTKDVITITSNDNKEKTTILERSILSDDFYLKLDDLLKN